ncbi:MAG: AMP-binding protein [Planctomycetes bacterium]|nr:AMP-binding protein [Planctomycetota bacterium]MCB9891724.1 AMP-binding protein [Planctomycetota bacterium]
MSRSSLERIFGTWSRLAWGWVLVLTTRASDWSAIAFWGTVLAWYVGSIPAVLGGQRWFDRCVPLVNAALLCVLALVGTGPIPGVVPVMLQGLLFAERARRGAHLARREDLAATRGRAWGTGFGSAFLVLVLGAWLGLDSVRICLIVAALAACMEALTRLGSGEADDSTPPFTDTQSPIRMRSDRSLWFALLALPAVFLFLGFLAGTLETYTWSSSWRVERHPSVLPAALALLGLAAGGYLAGRWSEGRIETGWIPFGTACQLLGCALWVVWRDDPTGRVACVFLVAFGLAWVLLPLEVLLRFRGPRAGTYRVAWSIWTLAGCGLACGLEFGLSQEWLVGPGVSWFPAVVLGVLAFLGTLVALWLLPSAFLRAFAYLVTHTIYRMRVLGGENVPARGACVLAPNHVSFADAMFVLAATDRNVRFLAEDEQFRSWVFGPLLRMNRAIPISSKGGPRQILKALREAGDELDRGAVVCLFPEGQITRTGAMQPFRRGLEKLVRGRDAVIVPMHLDRVWGSIFSFAGKKFFWKLPEEVPYRVTVSFGEPMRAETPVSAVRDAVQELSQRAWEARRKSARALHHLFVQRVRRAPWRLLLVDASGKSRRRLAALAGALVLARRFRARWSEQERIGVLLPPSVAGALVDAAALLAGKTVCNLNYTAGDSGMLAAARQAGFDEVITSRAFLEKAGLQLPEGLEPVHLEDEASRIGATARIAATLMALFAPVRLLERYAGMRRRVRGEDVATVIFSSGSTGEPKGVMLSHFNIASNVEAVAQVFRVERDDRLLGILPFFHSFGTMSLWFSLTRGVPLVMHANPVDAPTIGHLVRTRRVTILLATPTFLQVYLRRLDGEDFGSLRLVLAGAEKLSDELARAFEERFGVRPLEGYGTTECSPVVATSIPSHRGPGFHQRGWRRGFVGPPLPGVALRILDPDTRERLGPNEPGLLQVKGPNVMVGYLGRDDLTGKVLRNGWYETGDVALLDDEGFLRITDRLSRFSKIGGEMVPHGTIEEALERAYDASDGEQRFCVTAVPDEKRGERLVVLHTLGTTFDPGALIEALRTQGLSNLFLPRVDAFHHIEEIPRLGTGKTDLRAVQEMARERSSK